MNTFADLSNGQRIDALIGTYDINRFTSLARKLSSDEIFELITRIARLANSWIAGAGGMIIKYIGDAALYVFPDELVDQGMAALMSLKSEMESLLQEKGRGHTVTFGLHFGEVLVCRIPPFETWDVLGEAVNIAFTLDHGPYKGQFVISPQAFRKLAPATRKMFHKHTPPVVYLSERKAADAVSR